MPEFILDTGDAETTRAFNKLDDFTRGYIEAIFWTADDDLRAISELSLDELAPEALADMVETCAGFQQSFAAELALAYEHGGDSAKYPYDAHRAGVDFLLTRNRHGAGFWDRGLGDVGKKLTEMSHPYGSQDIYRGDDGRLYV